MKFNKKTLGWALLILGIWFFSPIPSPDDVIFLKLYSLYSGVSVGFENLSEIYLDYFLFTTVISIILILIGIQILGWSWGRIWRKIDPGKYRIALMVGGATIILVSLFNLQGNTPYILMGLVALIYFISIRKDLSESLAVFLTPFILLQFGTANLLNFIFQRIPIPAVLNIDRPVVLWISSTLGFEGITSLSLFASVIISFVIVFLLTKVLKERF